MVQIRVPGEAWHVDLDSVPPIVADTKGADIYVSATTELPDLGTVDSELTLAPLPENGRDPSERECSEQVQNNGAYWAVLRRGSRFCVQTKEGRNAFLRVLTSPVGEGLVRFRVIVWELE